MTIGLLLALGVSVLSHGQDDSAQVIAQVAEKSYVRGEFRQERHIAVLSLPLISSGVFTYRRNEGVIWETQTPVASRVEIRPAEGVLAGNDEHSLEAVAASDILAEIFLGIFSGNLDRLERLFDITETDASSVDNDHWRLLLAPAVPALARHIEQISLEGKEYVETIALREAGGDSTRIDLKILEAN